MNCRKKFRDLLSAILLFLLLSSCNSQPVPLPAMVAVPTPSPIATLRVTETLPVVPSATNLPTATFTPTPSPTATATVSPTPVKQIPQSGAIVFANSTGPQQWGIFILSFPGMELTELTGKHGVSSMNFHPSWSPDGKWIVYASDMVPLNNRLGSFDLYMVQSDGQNWHKLTFGGYNLDPDWSPDGQWIAYVINNEIGMISPDGVKSQILTYQPGIKNLPTWSPDGRFLAYLYYDFKNIDSGQGSEVWVLEVQTRRSYRVATDASSLQLTTLSWSPDGQRIIFSAHTNRDCTKLYSVENKENGRVETLSMLPAGHQDGMVWSPEGDWVSYVVSPTFTYTRAAADAGVKRSQLFIARPDGSNVIELADLPGIEPIQPEWRPLPKKMN